MWLEQGCQCNEAEEGHRCEGLSSNRKEGCFFFQHRHKEKRGCGKMEVLRWRRAMLSLKRVHHLLSCFVLVSFIYPVICLHKYRLMDICFLSVIYFPAQVASALVTGGFSVRSRVLGPCPHVASISLLSRDTKCSRLILFNSYFNPRHCHFSEEASSSY